MKFLNRKMIATTTGLLGLSAMLLLPVSQAQACGWRWPCHYRHYRYYHHWHPAGWIYYRNYRGCRRVVYRRFCRMHHGLRQCYVNRYARWVC